MSYRYFYNTFKEQLIWCGPLLIIHLMIVGYGLFTLNWLGVGLGSGLFAFTLWCMRTYYRNNIRPGR